MKLYRPSFTDKKSGKKKKCQHWYIHFTDNKMLRRQLPAFPDKAATERAAQKIQELLSSCGILSNELQRWIEEIPEAMRKRLIEFGLIDNRKLSENIGKPLLSHLEDFCEGLAADGRKEAYKQQTYNYIQLVLDGCSFKTWSDIDGNKVKTFLAKSRGSDGYGERTYNTYLRAFKMFCAWLIREDRVAGSDPMKGHSLIKQTEFRKKRRALTLDEIQRLLEATEAAPGRFNMSGHERALVYRLAIETGMRYSEIKSLQKLSFSFDIKPCKVRVDASDCKGKRTDNLILMDNTANMIKEFLKDKQMQDKAFVMPHKANAALMLKSDLKETERKDDNGDVIVKAIPYTDDAGRDIDFHALRHTFITNLALAQVHPAVAQKLARHSNIELTMKYYTHVLYKSEVEAIGSLENFTYASQIHEQNCTSVNSNGQKNVDDGSIKRLSA
jgi:site-specific recombinase XerC